MSLTNVFHHNVVFAQNDTQNSSKAPLTVGITTAARPIAYYETCTVGSGFCFDFIDQLSKNYDINPREIVNKELDISNLTSLQAKKHNRDKSLKKDTNKNDKIDLICGANTDLRKLVTSYGYNTSDGSDIKYDQNNKYLQWIDDWNEVDFSRDFYTTEIKLLIKKDSKLYKELTSDSKTNFKG